MITKKLKEGDTFYYILPRIYEENGKQHKTFNVFSYRYCEKYNDCFNQDWMFLTKEEADFKVIEVRMVEGY